LPVAVNIQALSHSFADRKVLRNVSLTVEQGMFVGLLGANGAGKTTLFSILTRLISNSSGNVGLFGHDLQRSPADALATLGVVFQQPTLDLDLSVLQNLQYHGAIQGMSPTDVQARAQEELERLQLWDRRHERIRWLNGGHRRRVEIARALLHQPQLLLLDEATSSLDLESRIQLIGHIRSLIKTEGLTVLWTTHVAEELETDDQVILLNRGEVHAQGKLSDLITAAGASDANHLMLNLSKSGS
jgi:ABC-2 type transport system ATP-binding protein